ncbi:MAG TPA: ABC transporter permease [Candidatus Micrarchaeia archaeon]|nr:ABC transporter permease [Candidatus Micrarchaeia archaeon]
MTGYLIRRVIQALVVVVGVTIIVFILLHLLPGGPARAVLGQRATKVAIAAFDKEYGLNKPLPVQYVTWVGQLVRGNLGFSYKLNQSVDSLLSENLPRTAILVGIAAVLATVVGVSLGIWQAVRRNRVDDYVLTGASFLFYAMPTFFLGLILIIIFSATLQWLPPTGPDGTVPIWDQMTNLILPVATLTLVYIALYSRYMRSSMLENLVQDYVRTARSKGVSPRRVLFRHVLRNAVMPQITILGLSLPGILSGALITEALFNYPGMGYLFWTAAQQQDYPILLGVTLIVGIATVIGSLVADLLYAAVDPRIRYA